MRVPIVVLCVFSLLAVTLTWGQDQKPTGAAAGMSNQNMSGNGVSNMKEMPGMGNGSDDPSDSNSATSAHAIEAMQHHHMEMGPHMKMTAWREPQAGDQERAEKIAGIARQAAEKYQDYHVALRDGYKIFLPNVPQKQYHFTNHWYAVEAAFGFHPEHPTSLLYQKSGDDYKLIGVMYTAPQRMSEDELDTRIPLSVAQWHEHVNFCAPPKDRRQEMWGSNPRFGLAGSISTQQDCAAAGGQFYPVIFGWMVHLYPFEKNPQEVWSVERQHDHRHLN